MATQLTNEEKNVRQQVAEVLKSLVLAVKGRFHAGNGTMASDGVSPLNKTPLSSNCSGTPEILIGTQPPGLKRINFERCLDGQIDQNLETFTSPTDMSAKRKIEHYRKLPSRTDGSDNMESLFEQGYDSDGERAPYLNCRDMDLEELEKSCDVRVGEEPPATGGISTIHQLQNPQRILKTNLFSLKRAN